MAAETGRLVVRRFHAEYAVPAGHPFPERVRGRLDEAVRRNLAEGLRATLASWFDGGDESIWFVRRLHVDLDVDAAWNQRRVARHCAARIGRSLAHLVAQAGNGGGAGVIRFDNRVAYLASFLADLAAGAAWGKWYYAPFDGLRMLPASAAIRTAICEDPRAGLGAMLGLPPPRFAHLLAALSAADARRVLAAMPAGAAAADAPRVWRALRAARELAGPDAETSLGLDLYVRVCRAEPDLSGPALRDACRAIARLIHLLAERGPGSGRSLLAALADPDPASLYLAVGPADAELLRSLREAPARWIDDYLESSKADRSDPAGEPRRTRFGGAFLLLRFLDRLPVASATRDWPPAGDTPAAAVVRLLLIAKCVGAPRAEAVFRDPLLRDLLGVGPALSLWETRAWARRLGRRRLDSFLATLGALDEPPSATPDPVAGPPAGANESLAALLARRHDLSPDIADLMLPRPIGLRRTVDLVLSVAARAVLRAFAVRLPGFAAPTSLYLSANFLDAAAHVEQEPARWVVWLEKPPLHFVLGLAGLDRGEHRPSWRPDLSLTLFTGEA